MIGIVIVAHGGLANELLATVHHVMGPQPGMHAISVGNEHDRGAKENEICRAANTVDEGRGVLIITDLCGGSPFNLCLRACDDGHTRQIMYGANLPMLIKLVQCRHKPIDEAIRCALQTGHKYMDTKHAMRKPQ